jgi:hypothetical protein
MAPSAGLGLIMANAPGPATPPPPPPPPYDDPPPQLFRTIAKTTRIPTVKNRYFMIPFIVLTPPSYHPFYMLNAGFLITAVISIA